MKINKKQLQEEKQNILLDFYIQKAAAAGNTDLVKDICSRTAFLLIELDALEEDLQRNGITLKKKTANGIDLTIQNPNYKVYIDLMKTYTSTVRMLNNITNYNPDTLDELTEWINAKSKKGGIDNGEAT